jgi:porin
VRTLLQATLCASAAFAQTAPQAPEVIAGRVPAQETGTESDHLTGDWGGLRSRLVDRGVHLYAGYTGEGLANVSGGIRRGAVYEGLLELAVDLDTTKLEWWENGLIHASSIYPHGSSISRYTGDLLTVSNIDAFDSIRLYELWIEQGFAGGKFNVRFGQLLADEEFAFSESAANFINSAFGWPAFISANVLNTGPAFYVAAPGLRLRFAPNENWYFQSAVYDGDSFDSATGDVHVNASGTRIHLGDEQGVFWLSEIGFQLAGPEALAGEYKIGAWLHTGEFTSNFHDRNGEPFLISGLDPKVHENSFGAYIAANQTIWREDDREISLFGRAGGSPPDRALFELVLDAGITLDGFFGRPDDQAGAGVSYARVSRDIRKLERLDFALNGPALTGLSDHETVLELFYSAQLTKWWTIQPDFQWIFNPGGNSGASDAIVLGIRTSIAF